METMIQVEFPKEVTQRQLLQHHHPATENKQERLLCCGEEEYYSEVEDHSHVEDFDEVERNAMQSIPDTAAGPHQHPVLATIISVSFLVGVIIFILVWMS